MVQLGIADHASVKDRDQGYDDQPQPIKFCMVGLFADAYYNERVKQMYKSGYLTEPDADRQLTAAEDNLFGAVVRNYCHVGYEYCSPFENGAGPTYDLRPRSHNFRIIYLTKALIITSLGFCALCILQRLGCWTYSSWCIFNSLF